MKDRHALQSRPRRYLLLLASTIANMLVPGNPPSLEGRLTTPSPAQPPSHTPDIIPYSQALKPSTLQGHPASSFHEHNARPPLRVADRRSAASNSHHLKASDQLHACLRYRRCTIDPVVGLLERSRWNLPCENSSSTRQVSDPRLSPTWNGFTSFPSPYCELRMAYSDWPVSSTRAMTRLVRLLLCGCLLPAERAGCDNALIRCLLAHDQLGKAFTCSLEFFSHVASCVAESRAILRDTTSFSRPSCVTSQYTASTLYIGRRLC